MRTCIRPPHECPQPLLAFALALAAARVAGTTTTTLKGPPPHPPVTRDGRPSPGTSVRDRPADSTGRTDSTAPPRTSGNRRHVGWYARQGGEITVFHLTDSSSLDPISGNSGNDHMSLYPMFDRLVNFDPETLEPTPGLATSWDQPDPQTLVLQLQDGVTFHDGTPFDAEAVEYNLERALTLDTSTEKADLAMIESVEATGPLEVTINMNRPDASLLLILADRPGMMVSPTAIEASGADFGRKPVGTGPFKFVEWRHRRPPRRGEEP